jgi:hypothetical protein
MKNAQFNLSLDARVGGWGKRVRQLPLEKVGSDGTIIFIIKIYLNEISCPYQIITSRQ